MTRVPVLEARGLSRTFQVRQGLGQHGLLHAVDSVDLVVQRGAIVGVVGESGSGKTTLARLLAQFYLPSGGQILLNGQSVASPQEYRSKVQLMFQDPFASLNSVHRVRYVLGRALKLHGFRGSRAQLRERILELLRQVRLEPAEDFIDKFPHEMSGGQRQRIVLARALAADPEVILADEPVSMLDVSIRADMLNLLHKLRDLGMSLLYITHDMASARYLCDEIVVMYAGQVVEHGPADEIVQAPRHPYTQLLVNSSPDPARNIGRDAQDALADAAESGEPPVTIDPPAGCRFADRCPFATQLCRHTDPPVFTTAVRHQARCWIYAEDGTTDRPQSGLAPRTSHA